MLLKLFKNRNVLIAIAALVVLCIAYSNHFHNGFHFDDTHTISNNTFIRDISNIPSFFTDLETFGTMANNRTYRPVVTTLNAIDYWLGGELNPFFFHLSIFCWYIAQLILMFLLFKHLFSFNLPKSHGDLLALLTVVFYGLHTANAETINYIIMRSDSFSTLCIIASLLLYIWPQGKKYKLYLLTMIIAIATKETGVMFIPILMLYAFLFEQGGNFTDLLRFKQNKEAIAALRSSLPALIIGVGFFAFTRMHFRPEASLFMTEHPSPPLKYFMTQWYVIAHYLSNFILPLNLSADPDFKIIHQFFDQRILLSLVLLLALAAVAIISSKKHKPIAFGILWFFIALAPTSSFKPFGQIANDHRTFFPYVGLVISLGYAIYLLWKKNEYQWKKSIAIRWISTIVLSCVLFLHAFGIHQRNKVWKNSDTLWKDVAEKSPENGRGLMNYGLTKMKNGEFEATLKLFNRAMELMPYYSYLHINMGILKNAMGHPAEAETYFQNALRYDYTNIEAYYHYANWLVGQNRLDQAKQMLDKGLKYSPGHIGSIQLREKLNVSPTAHLRMQAEQVKAQPTVDGYINLSVAYYQAGEYAKCIEACEAALKLNPDNANAFNNICSSYILLNEPEKAAEACKKAIALAPNFERAKNNLKWAQTLQQEKAAGK
jgi:tetratricopeptide (TPR) repeat protein